MNIVVTGALGKAGQAHVAAARLVWTTSETATGYLTGDPVLLPHCLPDPERNRHRTGEARPLRTVAVILANPRCTGRLVWDRQRSEPLGIDDQIEERLARRARRGPACWACPHARSTRCAGPG